MITAAPTVKKFSATFHGVAAHAGIDPEGGRSAIVAAARAVAAMPLGRRDAETTANIGLVEGGSAINVIPRAVRHARRCCRDAAKWAARLPPWCTRLRRPPPRVVDRGGGRADLGHGARR